MTIAGEVPTKGNLVLVPADPDALVVDGGDPAGALHVTVKYIGDLDRWDDDAREMAQEALTAWAARLGPVKATVTKVGPLGDEGAMVLFLDAPELSAAQPDLSEAIDSIAELFGADTTDKYPSYKPHLTVGYNVKAPEDMVGREVLFNTARAQWATGHVDAPLGAAVAALKPKRDGDGDGFVDDGTPMERPVIPGLDIDLDGNPVRPKGGNPQKVADIVAVKRNRVGNVDSDRLRRRRRRLIDEIDDDGQFYRGGRHGFAMRAAELTVIESELERRGELARKDRRTTTILADPNPPTPKRTVYHLTDKAKFKLDPKKVPEDNTLAIRQRDAAGLYVAKDSGGVESWVNGYGYLRPFVVELDVPEDVLTDERWGNEGFISADRFDEVEVKRVIPVDAFARETYNDYGWVESQLGARFDNGAQVPERRFGEPYEGVPKGWRYEGPDARDMTPAEVKRLRDGAAAARRARASGKEASRNPFAEQLDASGDSGSAASGWDGAVWRVPDEFDVWSREVPILPDRLLEWAARGANLGGLRNFDDNRLRNLRQLANDILSARRSGVPDDEMGDAHEKLWTWLTRRQDSRQALSRAIHDGPTAEERELYGIVHQHFLDYAERRWPEWGDVVPAQRVSTEDGPFDPNHGWKKQAERPKGGGSGFTSWDAMDYDEPYGHELRPRRDRRGTTVWVGDVPKSQVLGRFGDTENELLIASDAETLQRLIGEPDNSFATTDTPGEVGGAAAPVEMDDTFRKAVNQRGSRVNAEDMQDAWAVAVANPDDIEAIRAALPPIAIDRWQRLHGASPEESLRRGRGGMPSLEGMIAHTARRLTEAVPLTRDNLGVNGMPSSAEIVEHDPAMAKWLGITDRTSFGELHTAIARRPLANLLSDPEPDPQGIRYLKMLRRAAERDVGRRGGAVTLHRANTQGTDTPFDTKGGSGLTSWTTDYATAAKYAKGGVTVASVDVPGDRILAYDTFGIMASTGFYDFAGQDSYPLPGREVLVTSPEVIERLDAGEFPLLPPAAAGEAPAAPVVAAVDGDGDGFVYDGTPRMRPVGPQDIGAVKGGRKRKPFTERLDEGEAGSLAEPIKVLRRANIANVAERHREVVEDHYFETDGWTPYVPELDTETLHWAVYGANLIGVDGRDPDDDTSEILSMSVSAERLLRHLSYGSYANQRLGAKLNDDEYAFHMENVWLHLTQTQDARRALSRAAHDGPSEAEADFYRFVHQWFRQMSTEGTAAQGDTVPVRRYFLRDWFWVDTPEDAELPDDPFAPGTRWKEVGERPNAPGSGLTSWTSFPNRADFGHPIRRFAGDENGTPYWEGDAPKSQVLGRFGDVPDEVIVARDEATLRRLFGEDRNPFTETLDGDPDVTLGSGRGSDAPYLGMRPVTPDERKALRVEGQPIPPAWTDVYVATDPDAAMLARGLDRQGRHQYIYSAAHEARAAAAKYERTKAVAARVPALDAALQRDAMDDPTAAATALIRHFGLRPGSTADTKARKKAYGATTLQARHVRQYPDTMRTTLSFMGKSGQKVTVSTRDPWIYTLRERWTAGKEGTTPLFDTSDGLVLLYVKQHLGEEFLTKDLRTLLANVMALDMVSSMRRPTTVAKFKAARTKIADAVAKALGNTRQVTLSNYIDPTVFAPWEGALPA